MEEQLAAREGVLLQAPDDFDPESIDHDESLILWMLEKTATERLAILQDFVDAVWAFRNARRIAE